MNRRCQYSMMVMVAVVGVNGAFLGVDDAGGSVDSVFDGTFMLVCVGGGGVSGGGGLCRCRCVGGHLLLVL